MESFFFAETLKYLYLLYAPEHARLQWGDLQSEAHPMKRTWVFKNETGFVGDDGPAREFSASGELAIFS